MLLAALQHVAICFHSLSFVCESGRAHMRKEYDFSKGRRNPYAARLKRQVTIRLDEQTIAYFKEISQETGMPYQTLINLYLCDCAASRKRLSLTWKSVA